MDKKHDDWRYTGSPRRVPWLVRGPLLFGGFINQFGWGFFGFGLIFAWVFGLMADFSGLRFALGQVDTTAGVVIAVESTSATVNETPVYAVTYTYRVERLEAAYQDVAYATGRQFEPGWDVTVEYLRSNPAISRLPGTRRGMFPVWVLGIVAPFPLIGLVFMAFGLRRGLQAVSLLSTGQVGMGRFKSKEPTGVRVNNRPVYKLTFEFTADDGTLYEVSSQTHQPRLLQDERQEQLVYNPRRPAQAVMLDNLSGSPQLDDFGQIQPGSLKGALLTLILPAVTVLVHGTVLAVVLAVK